MERIRLEVRPLVVAIVFGFFLWMVFGILHQALWVLVLILLGFILAAALMPLVSLLRSIPLPPRGWVMPKALAVVIIYLTGALAFALIIYVVGAQLVRDLSQVVEFLPRTVEDLGEQVAYTAEYLGIPIELVPTPADLAAQVETILVQATEGIRLAILVVSGLAEFLFKLFIVLTLALFVVVESESIVGFWVELFPDRQRDRVRVLATRGGNQIGRWVLGQAAKATIVGALAGVGALILGLPYPALVAVIVAILDLAPVIGPILMVIPAFLLGLTNSLTQGIVAGAYFLALAEFAGHVLTPIITGRAVRLSPTLVIIAIPTGMALYGAIGVLVAIPVTAALQIVTVEVILPWLREQHSPGQESPEVPSCKHEFRVHHSDDRQRGEHQPDDRKHGGQEVDDHQTCCQTCREQEPV